MPTERLIAPKNVVVNEIRSRLNEQSIDAKVWTQMFEKVKDSFTIETIVSELDEPKYRDGKRGLIKKWGIKIEELPITELYPAIITDEDYYDSNAFLKHINRSLQFFLRPHIVVTVLHSNKHEFMVKFAVNVNPKKFPTSEQIDKIKYLNFKDVNKPSAALMEMLCWWSSKIKVEVNLSKRNVEDLKRDSIFAVFAQVNNRIVGAGGVKKQFLKNGEPAKFQGKQVVELFGVYVENEFREHNIASILVHMRLEYCKTNNLFPVAVTENKIMDLVNVGISKKIEELPDEYRKEYEKIHGMFDHECTCSSLEAINCKICPKPKGSINVFQAFIN